MLNDAAIKAKPTKYAQNKRHGMYGGTRFLMNCAPERCSAPKTASGIAKHKLVRARTLSRPRALAISFFAANTPIKKRATPAEQVATTVREISKMVARMAGYIDFPIEASDSIGTADANGNRRWDVGQPAGNSVSFRALGPRTHSHGMLIRRLALESSFS